MRAIFLNSLNFKTRESQHKSIPKFYRSSILAIIATVILIFPNHGSTDTSLDQEKNNNNSIECESKILDIEQKNPVSNNNNNM